MPAHKPSGSDSQGAFCMSKRGRWGPPHRKATEMSLTTADFTRTELDRVPEGTVVQRLAEGADMATLEAWRADRSAGTEHSLRYYLDKAFAKAGEVKETGKNWVSRAFSWVWDKVTRFGRWIGRGVRKAWNWTTSHTRRAWEWS